MPALVDGKTSYDGTAVVNRGGGRSAGVLHSFEAQG